MSRVEKLLRRWRENPPRKEVADTVFAVLRRYGFTERKGSGSSHHVFEHPALAEFPELYGADPHLTVPVKGGQKVKGFYLKEIVAAITLAIEWNRAYGAEANEGDDSYEEDG